MCGRYVPPDQAELERFWHIGRHNWRFPAEPVFNAAPTTEVPMVIRGDDGTIELRGARWGLIPSWWKQEVPPSLAFNARSEEAAVKPMWRQSLRTHRCLMPARGWYEWHQHEKAHSDSGRPIKQPYFIHCADSPVIAFAGLWATWQSPDRGTVVSCALLTKDAAPAIAPIHPRMPVVLAAGQFESWLNPAASPAQLGDTVAQARIDFEYYAVGTQVNDTRNDYPELLRRLPASDTPP